MMSRPLQEDDSREWVLEDERQAESYDKLIAQCMNDGPLTVLVAEDEPLSRRLLRRILTKAGYIVLIAPGGEEALELCQRYEGSIDLLLTDMMMPNMTGKELASAIAERHPQVRTLFTSGYQKNAIEHQGLIEEGDSFLPKPFDPDQLLRRLEALTDDR